MMEQEFMESPTPILKRTPSTAEHYPQSNQPQVSEFVTNEEISLISHMMHSTTLQEYQENKRHITDRFIPIRKSKCHHGLFTINHQSENYQSLRGKPIKQSKTTLDEIYRNTLLKTKNQKLLNFNEVKKVEKDKNRNDLKGQPRKVAATPFKVLDAPNLQDDFYLNLLEWSESNILSVALESALYFWNANNNKVTRFCELNPNLITSLIWNQMGSHIALGTSLGTTEIWDAVKGCRALTVLGHSSRVSCMAWSNNMLASGSRDRTINLRDIRQNPNEIVQSYDGHTQQVCGLKWSFDGNSLASGGNDNKLLVWNMHSNSPINKFTQHTAAVKGIAWSPHNHGILASGGGSVDRTIKFWNTLEDTLVDSIDTGSQVCNLLFSKSTKEIVSTHGFSNNEIIIWKYPTLEKSVILTGHSSRVLYLAMNPSNEVIVTGAGDETLRFWNVFPQKKKNMMRSQILSSMQIR